MNKLYIIGNGFDLYNGLKTRYQDFYRFLKQNHPNLFGFTCSIFLEQFEENDILWNNFETNLSAFDIEDFVIRLDEYSEGLSLVKLATYEEVEPYIIGWRKKLSNAFKEWIVSMTKNIGYYKKCFDNNDIFLTFNYTDTLQKKFGVDDKQILYLHNSINDEELIFGHNVEFQYEKMLDMYGLIDGENIKPYNNEEQELRDVWVQYKIGNLLQKPVKEIIKKHFNFIKRLDIVDEVIVLGHSVNKIDLPYFEWLFRGLPENINWKVSYYNEDEKKVIEKNLTIVGVSNYKLYKIDEILDIC